MLHLPGKTRFVPQLLLRLEVGDDRHRPDNLGGIFDFQPFPPPGVLRASEVRPGAAAEPPARYLMQKLERKYGSPILVIDQALGQRCNAHSLSNGIGKRRNLPKPRRTRRHWRLEFSMAWREFSVSHPDNLSRSMVAIARKFITVRSSEDGQEGLAVLWTKAAARKIARRTPGAVVVEATPEMFVEAIQKRMNEACRGSTSAANCMPRGRG